MQMMQEMFPRAARQHHWTDADSEAVREMWGSVAVADIAAKIGCSRGMVYHMAREIGVSGQSLPKKNYGTRRVGLAEAIRGRVASELRGAFAEAPENRDYVIVGRGWTLTISRALVEEMVVRRTRRQYRSLAKRGK